MATKKNTNGFVVLYSNCSSDDQLQVLFGGDDASATVFDTLKAAQAEAEQNISDRRESSEDIPDYAIAQIVARGKSSGITWK